MDNQHENQQQQDDFSAEKQSDVETAELDNPETSAISQPEQEPHVEDAHDEPYSDAAEEYDLDELGDEEGDRGDIRTLVDRQRGATGGKESRAPKGRRRAQRPEKEETAWKEKVIQIRRVTKVVKGGKKLSFRAVVVVGNGAGQVGLGIGKSSEVIGAIQKGVAAAKKNIINVPIYKTTIPHEITAHAGSATVVMRPASEGTGVIAGGAARAVLELAGIGNILSKSLGSNSPLNVARATISGLSRLRTFRDIAQLRGMSVKEMIM